MTRWTPLLLAGALGACSTPSEFPIGLYGVDQERHLAGLRTSGFDAVLAGPHDFEALGRLAAEAKRLGMSLIAYPDLLERESSARTRDWPIRAWYLEDEPDVKGTPPQTLAALSERVRRWDPERLQTFVIGSGEPAAKYRDVGDILMLDWYPVPHRELDSVAEQLDLARSGLAKGKRLWMVLQAFDWRSYPQTDPRKARVGRFPDHAELRFMSYLSIVHGANGLFYYTFRTQGGVLSNAPEHWQAVSRVVAELRSLQPVLARGEDLPLPFHPGGTGLEARALRLGGREVVIVLNRGKASAALPQELLKPSWRPLFEPRRTPEALLAPKGVLVLERRWRPNIG